MKLSLIAMSGSGKSYWSEKLAQHGFQRFDCDRMIASKLKLELRRSDGTVMPMGKWMGFPYQPGYHKRESQYLAHEKKVLQELFETIENSAAQTASMMVIDTTGSVIYTGQKILDKLRRYTTVVYLEIPLAIKHQMLAAYLAKPRPVLWQGLFVQHSDETHEDALARCYPVLLAERERRYKQYAHVTIAYNDHRNTDWQVADFLNAIKSAR